MELQSRIESFEENGDWLRFTNFVSFLDNIFNMNSAESYNWRSFCVVPRIYIYLCVRFSPIISLFVINLLTKHHKRFRWINSCSLLRVAGDLTVGAKCMIRFWSCNNSVNWHWVALVWRAIYNDPIINPMTVPETKRDEIPFHKCPQY